MRADSPLRYLLALELSGALPWLLLVHVLAPQPFWSFVLLQPLPLLAVAFQQHTLCTDWSTHAAGPELFRQGKHTLRGVTSLCSLWCGVSAVPAVGSNPPVRVCRSGQDAAHCCRVGPDRASLDAGAASRAPLPAVLEAAALDRHHPGLDSACNVDVSVCAPRHAAAHDASAAPHTVPPPTPLPARRYRADQSALRRQRQREERQQGTSTVRTEPGV